MSDIPLVVRVAANLDALRSNLAEGVSQIETTKVAMQQMATAYDGSRAISQAGAVTKAISDIGGVTKLTADEQAKANVILQAGIDKYAALGKEAPPQMVALAQATKQVHDETDGGVMAFLNGIPIIGQFIAAFSVERMFEFVKVAVEAAAQIDILSSATGVSRDALQRFAYVGADFHLGIEEMGKAIEQFSAKLANGDKNAVGAVQALGLNVKELLAAGPEEAFLRWADAAGRIDDPMVKGGNAAEVLGGRLAKTLLPALGDLRTRLNEVPQSAIISDANIEAAHRFDDGLAHLNITLKALAVGMFSDPMGPFGWLVAARPEVEKTTKAIIDMAVSHGQASAATTEHITKADILKNTLIAWRAEGQEPLTAAQRDAIQVGLDLGKGQGEIAKAINVSEGAVHQYIETQKSADAINKKYYDDVIAYEAVWAKFHLDTLKMQGENDKKWHDEAMKLLAVHNAAVVDGFESIRRAQQALNDFEDQSTLNSTDYQVKKIWDRANQEIASFKGTEEQKASFASATLTLASEQADRLYQIESDNADRTVTKLTQSVASLKAALTFSVDPKTLSPEQGGTRGAPGSYQYQFWQQLQGIFFQNNPPPVRDSGGPVTAGQSYMIGLNRQPEIFTPGASGFITPMNGAGGGSSPTVNVYVTQPLGTPQQIAAVVGPAIISTLRGQGMRIVSGA